MSDDDGRRRAKMTEDDDEITRRTAMAWRFLRGRGRQRVHSRPRVALAAEAARSARTEMSSGSGYRAQLGSSWAGANLLLAVDSGARGIGRGGGPQGGQGAVLAASPAVLLAAARASNRTVEDVWEEALSTWVSGGSEPSYASYPRPAAQSLERRYHVWREIDQTLGALRAG
jgi:hypothetical protein